MKKALSIILSFCITAAVFAGVGFRVSAGGVIDENVPTIVISAVNTSPGKSADVVITLKNNPGITSAKLIISFPDDLTLTQVTFGDIGGQAITSQRLVSPLCLNWFDGLKNMTESETVFATLTFTVADDAEQGARDITATYDPEDVCDINDVNVEFAVTDGKITVSNHIPGDINGDGSVNNKDLTRLFQYLSDWDVEVNESALDVNGDGSVNNKDLTRLFQYLSDWDVEIF